jgi:ATP-binding cassette subfamily B (MDR/TAP) protein 1
MYTEIIDYIRRQFVKDSIIHGFFLGLGICSYFMAYAAVYAASRVYLSNFSLDSEDMSTIMNVSNVALQEIANTIADLGNLPKAMDAFRAIYSTLDTISLINPFRIDNMSKISAHNINGKIEFRNVYFAYPTRPDNIILKNVSLTIMPGEKIGLIGSSGSGKSTIIQLISRFYDLEEGKGEILIDDVNIKDYNLYELRKKIGMISQDPSLFRVSLLDNIRYGKLNASNEKCLSAAKEADIIKLFEENQNKNQIEELNRDIIDYGKGTNNDILISGGEKQRISLARLFIKNPSIVLLDEPTSSLDKEAEIEVQKSLDKLTNDKTSIIISHRLNAVENCDKIFVMENGNIIEQGSYQELMAQKKIY